MDTLDLGPLEPGGSTPLYRQIAERIAARVANGTLPSGSRLPTVRALAKQLGVGTITAAQAYEALGAMGVTSGQVGRGTFIRERSLVGSRQSAEETRAENARDVSLSPTAYRVSPALVGDPELTPPSAALTLPPFPVPMRAARAALASPGRRRDTISLASGQPGPDVLPVAALKRAWRTATDELDGDALGYGPAAGDFDLRGAIAERCVGWGFATTANDVLITTGGQQGIDLVARALVGPGERVASEVPTFAAALDIFAASGARIVPVQTDTGGMDMSSLAAVCERERPRLIYTVPTAHNPLGTVLSVERRRQLLALAARYGALILEDDHCNPFVYGSDPPPPIKAGDTDGRVMYLWSAAKTVAPDLRVGAIVAGSSLMARLVTMKMVTDRFTARLPQRALFHYWNANGGKGATRDVATTLAAYRERRDAALAALATSMTPYATWNTPASGLNIWLTLQGGIAAGEVAGAALTEGVATVPGEAFYPPGVDVPPHYLRLTFADNPPDVLAEGIRRLAHACERVAALNTGERRAIALPV